MSQQPMSINSAFEPFRPKCAPTDGPLPHLGQVISFNTCSGYVKSKHLWPRIQGSTMIADNSLCIGCGAQYILVCVGAAPILCSNPNGWQQKMNDSQRSGAAPPAQSG